MENRYTYKPQGKQLASREKELVSHGMHHTEGFGKSGN
jgi:hypothetical protein